MHAAATARFLLKTVQRESDIQEEHGSVFLIPGLEHFDKWTLMALWDGFLVTFIVSQT